MHFGPLGDWVEELSALAFQAARLLSAVALRRCSAEKAPLLIRLRRDGRFKARSSQPSTGISKLFSVVVRSLKRSLGRPTLRFPSASSPYRSTLVIRWSFHVQGMSIPSCLCLLLESAYAGHVGTGEDLCVGDSFIFIILRRQVGKWINRLTCLL